MEKIKGIKLSLIILTYNSSGLIKACLDSVYQYNDLEPGELEIIVVDNSGDEEKIKLESILADYPAILYIKNSNKGYGQGNNVGIKKSKGSIISVMNPDVLLIKPIFKEVLKKFNADAQLAMLGGKQLGHLDTSFFIRPEKEFFIITLFLGLFFNKINYYNQNFMFLSGAFLFFDKKKFEEIGLFDEQIFLYCEEPDVTKRFLKKGYRTSFEKEMTYRHLIDGRNDLSDFTFKAGIASTSYYFKKFNMNYSFFLRQKVFSFMIKYHIHKLLGQNDKAQSAKFFLKKFREVLNNN